MRPRKDGKTVKTENDRENISAQCCKWQKPRTWRLRVIMDGDIITEPTRTEVYSAI